MLAVDRHNTCSTPVQRTCYMYMLHASQRSTWLSIAMHVTRACNILATCMFHIQRFAACYTRATYLLHACFALRVTLHADILRMLGTRMIHAKWLLVRLRLWQLLSTVLAIPTTVSAAAATSSRFLKWVRHGPVVIEAGTWLLVNYDGIVITVCVQEMADILRNEGSTVSLWCRDCHAQSVCEEIDGLIKVQKVQHPTSVHVQLVPGVALTELSCIDRGSYLECRYVW